MADYSYILYDTAVFTNAANQEHVLFQVNQGGDATHTESFTNARGAGSLPQQEEFIIKKIGVFADFNGAVADYQNMWYGSFLEVRVSEFRALWVPLVACAQFNEYKGHFSQATAADEALIGRKGDGLMLEMPITLEGGTFFRVRVVQSLALSVATANVKVLLHGTLRLPN